MVGMIDWQANVIVHFTPAPWVMYVKWYVEDLDKNTINISGQEIAWLNTNLAKLESITWLSEGEEAPDSATALIGEMKILIPMAGLIDVEAEKARLEKSMAKVQKDLEKSEKKISNPKFVDKAPEAVVNQEKERIDGFKTSIANLQEQLDKILMLK